MNQRSMRRRRARMQRMLRNFIVAFLMVLAFCSGFLGHTVLKAYAEEKPVNDKQAYYTSVQIRHNDTLWDLAHRYSEGSGFTTRQYVKELKRLNHLSSDKIRAGEFLTVVYFAE